jgi:small-conductance mechanosensitive channel
MRSEKIESSAIVNFILLILITLASIITGYLAFNNTGAAEAVASPAITAVTLLLTVSISFVAILTREIVIDPEVVKQKDAREDCEKDLRELNTIFLHRQKYLTTGYLMTVIFGLALIASHHVSSDALVTRVISSCFAFSTTSSVIISIKTPFAILRVLKRDNFFRN